MDTLIQNIVASGNYPVLETFTQEPRLERVRAIPTGYQDPVFRRVLAALGLPPNTVWINQGETLDIIDNGMSTVQTTATASGKTLAFQLASLKKIIVNPEARVLGFYPTRALNNDQTISWKRLLNAAGLPQEYLAMIDGSVEVEGRSAALAKARIAVMTPDVVHAWLMANIGDTQIQDFIRNIHLKVLDEAHLYDGSFGTHFAYLLRRLKLAQSVLNPNYDEETHGQIIAASATMEHPSDFLKLLTGNEFYSVDPEWDGSPQYERQFTLIGTPDYKRQDAAQRFLIALGRQGDLPGTTMCFVDSRRAVDEMAMDINRVLDPSGKTHPFLPYRSGYNAEDRLAIEEEIRNGTCKGVITTSALEVGIDIKGVRRVVMVGIPEDSASFRQRAGRIRTGGNVIVFEEEDRIKASGIRMQDKLSEPPRQPILYRTNTKLMAEQALCVLSELEMLGEENPRQTINAHQNVSWPKGFYDTVVQYLDKDDLPLEMARAIPPGKRSPHQYHPLRSFDGPSRRILVFDPSKDKYKTLGEVTQVQALDEAYPGAVVHFRGRSYRVTKWSGKSDLDRPIFARPLNDEEFADKLRTRGYVRTSYSTYLNDLRINERRYRTNAQGDFMADCKITVTKSVRGFSEQRGRKYRRMFYKSDGQPLTKSFHGKESEVSEEYEGAPAHAYDTTGVALRIGGRWFSKRVARRIGIMLKEAVCKEFSVSEKDISVTTSNIRINLRPNLPLEDKALLLYDKTPGSLLLSRNLFAHFPRVLARMIDQCTDQEASSWILQLNEWYEGLRFKKVPTYKQYARSHLPQQLEENEREVYMPGSVLEWTRNKGDAPVRVRVEDIDMVKGTLVYAIREVGYEYNPFRQKGQRDLIKPVVKPASYLSTHFVSASQLSEPAVASFKFGVWNTVTKKIVTTSYTRSNAAAPAANDDAPVPPPAAGSDAEPKP